MARKKIEHAPSQMSLLTRPFTPEEAALHHKARLALSDLAAYYDARQAKLLAGAPQINSPREAYEFLRVEMENLEQEQLRVLNLNTKNRIISAPLIYQGSVHTTVIRLAEIFRPAILDNATSLLIAHNHPSGECDPPSPEDIALTRELVKAGQLLDLEVVDHLIIGRGSIGYVSLKERRLGF